MLHTLLQFVTIWLSECNERRVALSRLAFGNHCELCAVHITLQMINKKLGARSSRSRAAEKESPVKSTLYIYKNSQIFFK